MKIFPLLLGSLFVAVVAVFSQANNTAGTTRPWQFAVSGDSRNCGDIVMPAIAQDLAKTNAGFYWHLGDLRAVDDFDEDIKQRAGAKPLTIFAYESGVWQDMIENQIDRFKVPFFLGIGNHESVSPKTRSDFIIQFADWLNMPVIQNQRLKDDPNDHKLKAYYHWQQGGVDFIYLDNASADQFDSAQLNWFNKVIDRTEANAAITTIVVGMHQALPDSLAFDHSMSDFAQGVQSGRLIYQRLLKARDLGHKMVYILASHSHFLMSDIFNSDYCKANGGVLPGWIVGTAGAVRYALPRNAEKNSPIAITNVYGYLLATVNPPNTSAGTISFDFRQTKEPDVPADVRTKFGADLVHWCFEKNSNVY